ncbi:Phosphopentomutase [Syntrophomonas zehnderi OL-4]|uniref:Phosphopentomutase n=1 Tax=Syntrophomonas zehnderi OL-4 TaxID=690567 RepID=A0A0E4GAK0_9FIRM|nr:phosphopentomutase [Syntrophomonas zehnderi]CFX50956.1 Phosphopentomutase [Syntrophomonas zehnderi OL-4]
MSRAIVIVLDSVGIGELEDSHLYGDEGSNTLVNTARAVGGLHLPHMQALGLGNLDDIMGVDPIANSQGAYGIMKEKSAGKDTTTGHWEMMGIKLDKPFPTYPQGFPLALVEEFERRIGRRTLGNLVASGTEIIKELGQQHLETGYPIIYTSADSVFQIAAHEEIIPLEELYEMCRIARAMLQHENGVGRVIARPFVGQAGNFIRTSNRHDYSLQPSENLIDLIKNAGHKVVGVGKIKDIFAGRGIDESYPIKNNQDGVEKTLKIIQESSFTGLLFVNLIDFDQQYGHRNDPRGYAQALEEFDSRLPEIMAALGPNDLLFITADHGCDPTTPSTDHSRERVPLLVYGAKIKGGTPIGIRESFADLGQTIAEYLKIKADKLYGNSFLQEIIKL